MVTDLDRSKLCEHTDNVTIGPKPETGSGERWVGSEAGAPLLPNVFLVATAINYKHLRDPTRYIDDGLRRPSVMGSLVAGLLESKPYRRGDSGPSLGPVHITALRC